MNQGKWENLRGFRSVRKDEMLPCAGAHRIAGRVARGILAGLWGIILLAGAGCSRKEGAERASPAPVGVKTITDVAGRQVTMPDPLRSIVCVNVGTLRFTTYMQALDLVIGVEQNELQPNISKLFNYVNNDRLSKLPVMGDNGTVYEEEVIALSPDLIMAALDAESADALREKTGIPVFTIPLIDNMFDTACYRPHLRRGASPVHVKRNYAAAQ